MNEPSVPFDFDAIDQSPEPVQVSDENILAFGVLYMWLMDGGPKTKKPDIARWAALWWAINDSENSHITQSKIAIDLKISKKKLCEAVTAFRSIFPFKSRNIRPDDVRAKYSELKAKYHERRKAAAGSRTPSHPTPDQG